MKTTTLSKTTNNILFELISELDVTQNLEKSIKNVFNILINSFDLKAIFYIPLSTNNKLPDILQTNNNREDFTLRSLILNDIIQLKRESHNEIIQKEPYGKMIKTIEHSNQLNSVLGIITKTKNLSDELQQAFKTLNYLIKKNVDFNIIERDLNDHKEKLNEVQRIAKIGYWEYDFKEDKFYGTGETHKLYGFSPNIKEITLKQFISIVHPEDRDYVIKRMNQALKKQIDYEVDTRILLPTNEVKFVHVRRRNHFKNNEPTKSYGTVQDISERKKLEIELQNKQDYLSLALETAAIGICEYNIFHDKIFYDEQFANIFQLNKESDAKCFSDIKNYLHPDYKDILKKILSDTKKKNSFQYEIKIKTGEGNAKWIKCKGKITERNMKNKPERILVTILDISKSKESEKKLIEREEILKTILENMPVMLNAINEEGNFVFWNKECERITGFSKKEILNNPMAFEMLYNSKYHISRVLEKWNDLISSYRNKEHIIHCKDGGTKTILWSNLSEEHPIPGWTSWKVGIDISDKKMAERSLSELEKEKSAILELVEEQINFIDTNYTIKWANTSSKQSSLIDNAEGKKCYEVFYNRETPCEICPTQIAIKENRNVQMFITNKKGKILLVNTKPVKDEHGNIIGTLETALDVSEIKKTNSALIESNQKLESLFKAIPDHIMVINNKGIICEYHPSELDILIQDSGNIENHKLDQVLPSEIADNLHQSTLIALKQDQTIITEFNIHNPNRKFYKVHLVPKNHEEVVVTLRNFTETRIATEELKKSEKKYRTLIEAADDRISLFDHKGKLLLTNSTYYKKIGYSEAEFHKTNEALIYEKQYLENRNERKEILKKEGIYSFEYKLKHKKGHWMDMYAKCVKISDESNNSIGTLAITSDVTQLKKTQNDLLVAKQKAEENDRLKSAFLANMSHELRTPLNAITGFSTLLIDKSLTQQKREKFARIITNSSRQLLTIINDIVDISKLESNQIEINESRININHFLNELYTMFSNQVEQDHEKSINIFLQKSETDPNAYLKTDYTRLNQIMCNLIGNAIKFTTQGFVEFGYKLNDNKMTFFVKDTGIGISQEMQKRIFEAFVQENDEISKKFGGNGLGLAISKSLVNKLGGDIWLESEKDNGTRFYFSLPVN